LKDAEVADDAAAEVGVVFHFAANPEVRVGETDPSVHFRENLVCSFNVLEAMRRSETAKALVFASTSTVYGDVKVIPTPEDYGSLEPISVYGASKLASEALIVAYAHTYGFAALILRFANVVGSRSGHGVIFDFVKKLRENAKLLEILGDGTQTKSYLYIEDCVSAVLTGFEAMQGRVEVLNVGSEDQVSVREIAEIVVEEMGLKDVMFRFTGGVKGGRGWVGDVKNMLLDVGRLKAKGWKPKYNSGEAVKETTRRIKV